MRIHPFPGLTAQALFGPALRQPPVLPEGAILTHLGRTALVQALRILGLKSGEEVLIPSYHCGVEVEAARFAGAAVSFYRVRDSLRIEPEDVASRINATTRAVLITHYFGLPQESRALEKICRSRGVFLLEDCAHVFIGAPREAGLPGTMGDAAVYSLPKFLPVPDGGILLLCCSCPGREPPEVPNLSPPPGLPILRRTTRLLLDRLEEVHPRWAGLIDRSFLEPARRLLNPRQRNTARAGDFDRYNPGSSVFEPAVAEAAASATTRRILAKSDIATISRRRRENYAHLSATLIGIPNATLLAPVLPSGSVPLVFPVRLENRAEVRARMAALGIATFLFGAKATASFPEDEFPEARDLSEQVLGLPVHQDLGPYELDRVASVLRWSV